MGGNSGGSRYTPVAGGKPALNPDARTGGSGSGNRYAPQDTAAWTDQQHQAGGRWELPKAPPGSPQGIARNWVTPPPPREQLAQAMAMDPRMLGNNSGWGNGGAAGKPLSNVDWGTLGNPAGWSLNPLDAKNFRFPTAQGGIGSNPGYGYNSAGMRTSAGYGGGSSAGGYSTSGRGF